MGIFQKIIPVFIFLFLGEYALLGQYKNQLDEYRLFGPVKTITANEVVIRDSAGSKKTFAYYSPNLFYRYLVNFNKEGNISSEKLKDTTKPLYVNFYNYDAENRLIKIARNRDGEISEAVIKHEIKGDTVLVYEQDFTGKKILTSRKVIKNNLLLRNQKFDNDTLSSAYLYTYNDQGKIISMEVFWDNKYREIYQYKWKKNVRSKCVMKYFDGRKWKETVFWYDKHGNVIKETHKGEMGYTMISEYTYDKQGNWLTRKKYFEDQKKGSVFFAERKITYYE